MRTPQSEVLKALCGCGVRKVRWIGAIEIDKLRSGYFLRSNMGVVTVLTTQASTHHLTSCGESLHLSAHRTAYSPIHKALFVADVHLGKAATFRRLGVPVPAGTTQANLSRLSAAIAQFDVQALYFLGDLLHAKAAHNPSLLAALADWRQHHAHIHMALVRGNHDSRAGDPPADLNIAVVEEPFALGGFALCHHPQQVHGALALAGHEHPVVRMEGKGRDRARLPCFVRRDALLVLPSFGEFTGGHAVETNSGDEIIPVLPVHDLITC
ncbi:MAG TPA: ligase-associated DNA damage response endonuclease PdeM [Limnobacter sp.]|nr:ligase-associated DNA damage response endonuclease PdeM [Limnobacter sp.]